jgi:hypothetical protein
MSDEPKVYWGVGAVSFALVVLCPPAAPLIAIGAFIYVIAREYHHHGGWK